MRNSLNFGTDSHPKHPGDADDFRPGTLPHRVPDWRVRVHARRRYVTLPGIFPRWMTLQTSVIRGKATAWLPPPERYWLPGTLYRHDRGAISASAQPID